MTHETNKRWVEALGRHVLGRNVGDERLEGAADRTVSEIEAELDEAHGAVRAIRRFLGSEPEDAEDPVAGFIDFLEELDGELRRAREFESALADALVGLGLFVPTKPEDIAKALAPLRDGVELAAVATFGEVARGTEILPLLARIAAARSRSNDRNIAALEELPQRIANAVADAISTVFVESLADYHGKLVAPPFEAILANIEKERRRADRAAYEAELDAVGLGSAERRELSLGDVPSIDSPLAPDDRKLATNLADELEARDAEERRSSYYRKPPR